MSDDQEPVAQQSLPDPGLTDDERGSTSSPRRRLVTFAAVLTVIGAAVVGIALGSDATDDERTSDGATASTTPATPTPDPEASADAPAPGDVAQARLVQDEDARIWKAVSRGTGGGTIRSGRSRTVVLDRRPEGAYGLPDLVRLGAASRTSRGVVTLEESVVIRTGARLVVDAPGTTLRLAATDSSFASIVAWGGSLTVTGSKDRPVTVVGWDLTTGAPDTDVTDGRGYLRAHSGHLTVRYADLDRLGFWSGRTGGAAVTGTTFEPGRATVRDTDVTGTHIGLYLYGTRRVSVARTSITGADRDGVELDRSTRARLADVTIDGSGLNGLRAHDDSSALRVDRGTITGSAGYGVTVDGRPRADGPNALGYGVDNVHGLRLSGTTIGGNGSGGLLVAGTSAVTLDGLTVRETRRPVRIVGRSTRTTLTGSRLTSGRGPVVQVEDGARGVAVTGSTIDGTTSGVVVEGSGVDVTGNTITIARGAAVTADGDDVSGTIGGNTVVGEGPDAFEVPDSARRMTVGDNTTTGWVTTHRVLDWIERNPFAPLWVAILLIPAVGVAFVVRRHRMHRELRRLTEETVIAMAKARRHGEPAVVVTAVAAPSADTAPLHAPVPAPEVTRTDRLVTRGAMGQFASAEDLAIHAVLQGGKSPERVARTLQVPVAVVHDWLQHHTTPPDGAGVSRGG